MNFLPGGINTRALRHPALWTTKRCEIAADQRGEQEIKKHPGALAQCSWVSNRQSGPDSEPHTVMIMGIDLFYEMLESFLDCEMEDYDITSDERFSTSHSRFLAQNIKETCLHAPLVLR